MEHRLGEALEELREYCAQYSEIAIYGAGNTGRMAAKFLKEQGIRFDSFCVTTKRKDFYEGRPVKLAREISARDTGVIVAVAKQSVKSVLDLLEQGGHTPYCNHVFLDHLLWMECGEYAAKVRVENGYLAGIEGVPLAHDTTYVVPVGGIGDVLYFSGLMEAYKRENPKVKKVYVVLRERHQNLANLFAGVDKYIISDELSDLAARCFAYSGTERLKNYIFARTENAEKEFLTSFQRGLGLSNNARLEKACLNTERFEIKKQERTIVIAPFTNSGILLPEAFWEALVSALKRKGYTIYTNLSSYQNERVKEHPFEGTKLMNKNLMEAVAFCENCDAVIAVRCGMCDLLAFSKACEIVLNPAEDFGLYWNLKKVFDREGIYNVNCFQNPTRGDDSPNHGNPGHKKEAGRFMTWFSRPCQRSGLFDIVPRLDHEGTSGTSCPTIPAALNRMVLQGPAMRIAKKKELPVERFRRNHPGGAIGKKLADLP